MSLDKHGAGYSSLTDNNHNGKDEPKVASEGGLERHLKVCMNACMYIRM